MRRTQLTQTGVNLRTAGLFVLMLAAAVAVGGGSSGLAGISAVAGFVLVTVGASMRRDSPSP